jgi:hypothetical protein
MIIVKASGTDLSYVPTMAALHSTLMLQVSCKGFFHSTTTSYVHELNFPAQIFHGTVF